MGNSKRVLTDLNGPWDAQVVFVAEAPGRLGAEVTGVPLFGDRTGDRFEELLSAMGWNRSDVFITNAVLCNPRDQHGNNDTPTRKEIANCSRLLCQTIDVIDPLLVVALGRVALDALRAVSDHEAELRRCAGKVIPWAKRRLGILYHPGPRTAVHRSWRLQLSDAQQIAEAASCFLQPVTHGAAYQEKLLPMGPLDYKPAI
jgi:uracil-DNA glycosylase family 4